MHARAGLAVLVAALVVHPRVGTGTEGVLVVAHPDLSGSYRLNRAKSDDPREKMREARVGERGGGGGPRGGIGMGGPGGRGGRGGGGQGGRSGGRGAGGSYPGGPGGKGGEFPEGGGGGLGAGGGLFGGETLVLRQQDDRIEIESGRGGVQSLAPAAAAPDGSEEPEAEPKEREVAVRSWWNGDELVVERRLPEGRKVTETYALAPGGKELTLLVRMEGGLARKPVVLLRVYEREPPLPALAPAPSASPSTVP